MGHCKRKLLQDAAHNLNSLYVTLPDGSMTIREKKDSTALDLCETMQGGSIISNMQYSVNDPLFG